MKLNRLLKTKLAVILVLVLSITVSGFLVNDSFAAIDIKTIKTKAAYEGVYNCRQNYNMDFDIFTNYDYSLAKGSEWISFNRKQTALIVSDGSDSAVKLPYHFTAADDNTLNCKEVMVGFSDALTNSFASENDKLAQGLIPSKYHKASTSTAADKQAGNQSSLALSAQEGIDSSWTNTKVVDIVKFLAGDGLNGSGGIGFKATQGSDNKARYDMKALSSSRESFAMDLIKGLDSKNNIGYKLGAIDGYGDLALTSQEIADLYSYYLIDANIFEVPYACEGDDTYDSLPSTNQLKVGDKQCRFKVSDANSPSYAVYGVKGDNHFGATVTASQAFDKVKKLVESGEANLGEMAALMAGSSVSDSDSDGGESDPTCTSMGGGGSLGWILCPVLNFLSDSADSFYSYIQRFLDVDPALFSGGDEGARTAWETFRNMANVVFIILLLVVIISQLTGVGIDNYGVKKILPKLILSAVLINLSYLICLIAVDFSNIVGNGIMGLFDSLPSGELATTIEGAQWSVGSGLVSIGIISIVGVSAFIVFMKNPAVLLSLLVSALGIVIAIIFLFVLLAAREAAIIVLIIISPLAFACLMLPNTKKYFEKWLKAGQGLLLLYPVCSLMIGGGDYVSRLMMSVNENAGFMSALFAMLIGIAPIFFIPTVLKGAFAAFGSIGAKLSGLGDKMRGGATRGIRSSEGYKRLRTQVNAGTDSQGNLRGLGRVRNKIGSSALGKRFPTLGSSQYRAMSAVKKQYNEDTEGQAELTNAAAKDIIARQYGGDSEAYYTDLYTRAGRNKDYAGMDAALRAMRSSGRMADKQIAEIVNKNAGLFDAMDDATRADSLAKLSQQHGDVLAKDPKASLWASYNGMQNGRRVSLDDFDIDPSDLKVETLSKASMTNVIRLANEGKIDQGLARSVLAENKNMDSDTRITWNAIAEGMLSKGSLDIPGGTKADTEARVKLFKDDVARLRGGQKARNGVGLDVVNGASASERRATIERWTTPPTQRVQIVP